MMACAQRDPPRCLAGTAVSCIVMGRLSTVRLGTGAGGTGDAISVCGAGTSLGCRTAPGVGVLTLRLYAPWRRFRGLEPPNDVQSVLSVGTAFIGFSNGAITIKLKNLCPGCQHVRPEDPL